MQRFILADLVDFEDEESQEIISQQHTDVQRQVHA